jgi:hypothetical protein
MLCLHTQRGTLATAAELRDVDAAAVPWAPAVLAAARGNSPVGRWTASRHELEGSTDVYADG